MCKAKAPDTSAQQAEAARQAQVQEAQYQQSLAAQQAEWEKQRQDSEARYQAQLAAMQAETARQAKLQSDQAAATEATRQKQIDDQNAINTRGQAYADYRDKTISDAQAKVKGQFSQFDDAYFNNYAKQFTDANRVDTDNSWTRGKRDMTYKLADARNLNSSAAADAFGEMDTDHNSAIAKIAAAGQDKAFAYKQQIQNQQNNDLNSLLALGNTAVPTFTDDASAQAAQSKIGQTVAQMAQNLHPVTY